MNRINAVWLCLLFFLVAGTAQAKDEGFYLGASLGSATIEQEGSDPDLGDFNFDEDDFAWKIFGGYQFNGLLAIEGGYVDLGSPSDSGSEVDPYGLDLFAVAGIPLGPMRVFGKLGGIYWDSDLTQDGDKISDDGFDVAAGAGLEFELGSFALRGEVEYLDVLDGTWMYTIGATVTF
ncbi:outer membrane beta-barrel protein [Ferrimonas sediminicola]|nr:outer membrane beta-barrel protein [Ferrimonas sediminicola]